MMVASKITDQFNEGIKRATNLNKIYGSEKVSYISMDYGKCVTQDFSQIPGDSKIPVLEEET